MLSPAATSRGDHARGADSGRAGSAPLPGSTPSPPEGPGRPWGGRDPSRVSSLPWRLRGRGGSAAGAVAGAGAGAAPAAAPAGGSAAQGARVRACVCVHLERIIGEGFQKVENVT